METIIKGYLGIFFIGLTLVFGMAIVSASIDQRQATSYATGFASRIEASNGSINVIEQCKEEATSLGYSIDTVPGQMDFEYVYEVPLLGINKTRKIVVPIR